MNDLAVPFYPVIPSETDGKPTYEVLVSAGIEAVERQDVERWILGYLGSLVSRHYGHGNFVGWCHDIGVNPKTAYNYVKVQGFFGEPFNDLPMLKWMHYLHAIHVASRYQGVTREEIVGALIFANAQGFSAETFAERFKNGLETRGHLPVGKAPKEEIQRELPDPDVAEANADLDKVDLTETEPNASRYIWRSTARVTNVQPRGDGRYLISLLVENPLFADLASESQVVIAMATVGTIIDDIDD